MAAGSEKEASTELKHHPVNKPTNYLDFDNGTTKGINNKQYRIRILSNTTYSNLKVILLLVRLARRLKSRILHMLKTMEIRTSLDSEDRVRHKGGRVVMSILQLLPKTVSPSV